MRPSASGRGVSRDPVGHGEAATIEKRSGVVEESVYRFVELVGTSTTSWEEAAASAVNLAGTTLEDLRVAEIIELDMRLQDKDRKSVV
jgi:dodecin